MPTSWTMYSCAMVALMATLGCDAQPRTQDVTTIATAADVPVAARAESKKKRNAQDEAAKPDLNRIHYHAESRTLTVYPLDAKSARWMMIQPSAPAGVPIAGQYQFPKDADIDLNQIAIFYTLSNHRPSPTVTLQEVVEAQQSPVSHTP